MSNETMGQAFKRALLECARNGELRRCGNVGAWLDEEGAADLEEQVLRLEAEFEGGVEAFSLIGLLGPLCQHEPVLASVLLQMVAGEEGR